MVHDAPQALVLLATLVTFLIVLLDLLVWPLNKVKVHYKSKVSIFRKISEKLSTGKIPLMV